MKLKKYIEILKEIEEGYGGDLEMVYATDEEGNAFATVFYRPSAGFFDDYFVGIDDEDWERGYTEGRYKVNCVCVN